MNTFINIIVFILFLFSLTFYSFLYLSGQINIFNSDSLLLPSFISSLTDGHSFKDWVLPPGNSIFPEGLLFYLSNFFSNSVFFQYYIVNILTFLITYFVMFKFAKFINSDFPYFISTFSISILIILGSMDITPYKNMLYTTYHYGSFLNLLLALLVISMILFETNFNNRLYLILALIICTFSIFSDRLFVVQFLLPFVFSYILFYLNFYFIKIQKVFFYIILTFFIAFIFSYLLGNLLIIHEWPSSPKIILFGLNPFVIINHLNFQLENFYKMILRLFYSNRIFFIFIIFLYLSLFYKLIIQKSYIQDKYSLRSTFLLYFIFTSLFLNIIVLFLINYPIHHRYFLTFSFFPIFGMMLIFKNKITNLTLIFSFLLIIIFAVFKDSDIKNFSIKDFEFEYYTKDHKCIDSYIEKFNLSSGISHYVNARYFSIFLKNDVNIYPYREDLTPDYKASSKKGFKFNDFDFVLLDSSKNDYKIYLKNMIKILGYPLNSATCGRYDLKVYKKP